MMACVVSLCGASFVALGWQAFKARNISTEFSESTYLGIAVFSWMQLSVVGIPVMFLVEESNVVARYGLTVGLLLAVCMSILLFVFAPIVYIKNHPTSRSNAHVSGFNISSLDFSVKQGQDSNNSRNNNVGSSSLHEQCVNGDGCQSSLSPKHLHRVQEQSHSSSRSRNPSSANTEIRDHLTRNRDDVENGGFGTQPDSSDDIGRCDTPGGGSGDESWGTSPTVVAESDDNFAVQRTE
jgi:hypothetical protein